MKRNLFFMVCISLCFITCKNTSKEIVTETKNETVQNIPEPKTETSVNIESTVQNEKINIPEKKTLEVVIQKETKNTPKPLPELQVIEDDPKIDSRLKFKLEEINSDELDSKICGLFETIEEKILAGDFLGWYNSLSSNYRSFIENPDELLKMSKKSG
ncbi:MAG: hypothetical protein IKA37_08505, partial [Spirochaetales bacterium]|nr:hypothetical protein [Spirochaetales bacterium]